MVSSSLRLPKVLSSTSHVSSVLHSRLPAKVICVPDCRRNDYFNRGRLKPRELRTRAAALLEDLVAEKAVQRKLSSLKMGMGGLSEPWQPKPLPLSCKNGQLTAEGGFTILDNIPANVTVHKAKQLDAAMVLGLKTENGVASSSLDAGLGNLRCTRWMGCARIKIYWMAPEWGYSASDIAPETQFLLLQLGKGGPFACVLPLIDSGKFRATLRPPRDGMDPKDLLRVRVESTDNAVMSSSWDSSVLIAAGYDPYSLVDKAVAAAASLSGGAKPRVDKVLPDFANVFGWCSWDAYYQHVSSTGITQGLTTLAEGKVPPRFLIIDDGWQQTGVDASNNDNATARMAAKKKFLKDIGSGVVPSNMLVADSSNVGGNNKYKSKNALMGFFDRTVGRLQALAETAGYGVYKYLIEEAPADSWRIAFVTSLANGVLKDALLSYYTVTSDHVQRLRGVRANGKFSSSEATPETSMSLKDDLKTVVADVRAKFGVQYVHAWHSLYGYWAGIATGNSKEMPYNAQLVLPRPTPGVLEIDPCFAWQQQVLVGVGVAEDVRTLYKDMHSFLADAGIDGVKVDCQSTLGMIGGGKPGLGGGPAMAAQYHSALEDSVRQYFPGNNCINCMCHSTEDIYRMEDTTIARSSDDFWPREPASHTTHVAVNAYNSLFMSAILQPDWDMFQSKHPAGLLHATARVISGGPLYVSDKPGQHDFDLLRRLVLPDGSLLRCLEPGRPTVDCMFDDVMRDGQSLLKVWNMNECSGVVAAFNVQGASWSRTQRKYAVHHPAPRTLSIPIRAADLPPFQGMQARGKEAQFIIYSDSQRQMYQCGLLEGINARLAAGKSDLFTLVPLQRMGEAWVAPIGLVNMLNCGGTVSAWEADEAARKFSFKVRGCGQLLAYSSLWPKRCTVNGEVVDFVYTPEDCGIVCDILEERSHVVVEV